MPRDIGWQVDDAGARRYWDGNVWLDNEPEIYVIEEEEVVVPPPPPVVAVAPPPPPPPPRVVEPVVEEVPAPNPLRWLWWLLGLLLLGGLIWWLARSCNRPATVETAPTPTQPVATVPAGECAGDPVTLTVSTFNNFGFGAPSGDRPGADLWDKYHAEHPCVTVNETVAATSDDARAAFNTAISAGSGAYDIQAVDVDWMPSIMALPDHFVNLQQYAGSNDWMPWKVAQATTPDGRVLGFGTDIGPEGLCYRSDLFAEAGLPTDREEVAALFGGNNATWDQFFQVGAQYHQATGRPFFDSSAALFQGMVNQIEYSWVDSSGNIIATDNTQAQHLYNQLTAAALDGQSAGLGQWSPDWNAAMSTDQFAVMLCPAWIINNIKGNAGDNFVGWDIANVFPGGGGNWGGSFLVVPSQGTHQEEAAELAAWITAPEQQAAVFEAASNFPSSPTAQADPRVSNKVEPFLNNAPVGQIFANRAAAVTVVPFKGAQYFDIQTKMADALNRVDVDRTMSPEQSWNQWVTDVRALG
ncbi:MAG: extracellular solute-binding protein [Cellulomonadaceae bacterium]|jgi:cellobiose transport system substrate-binding protein|nr:extracellular solute-binding protein [Cellulomonadaceae bacterium]